MIYTDLELYFSGNCKYLRKAITNPKPSSKATSIMSSPGRENAAISLIASTELATSIARKQTRAVRSNGISLVLLSAAEVFWMLFRFDFCARFVALGFLEPNTIAGRTAREEARLKPIRP